MAGQPTSIKEYRNECIELIITGNFAISMPELTDAGVPGGSESLLYGEDIFIHMRAFPFGFSFTVIGFKIYEA